MAGAGRPVAQRVPDVRHRTSIGRLPYQTFGRGQKQRRMHRGPAAAPDSRPRTLRQLPVERAGLGLLLPAAFMRGPPLGVPRSQLLRRRRSKRST